ncbi:MAG TPA: hypothetical protein VK435_01020 [Thermodesulfovibrionales bacterium]|nr:hypothetical protein [Thermodesulfovibrionales bacterium]
MWTRITSNFENGISKLKWFASLFSDRLKVEFSVMKLLYETDRMERRKDELAKAIGRRFLELKGQPERNIVKDRIIAESLSEIEQLNGEIETTKKQASDISRTV